MKIEREVATALPPVLQVTLWRIFPCALLQVMKYNEIMLSFSPQQNEEIFLLDLLSLIHSTRNDYISTLRLPSYISFERQPGSE